MKQPDRIEFGISDVKFGGPETIIEGRCHCGPIRIGDTFTKISEMTVHTRPRTYGPTTLRAIASVEIRVDSISAYGHELEELSQTMTARIAVSGIGVEHLKEGLVLS